MFTYFYHERIRKSVATFGKLFNDVYVIRKNSAGAALSQVKVPLAYAPKDKYLERIREQADLPDGQRVALKLPRMSFEIISMSYDAQRQLQKSANFTQGGASSTLRSKFQSSVPYNISFQLNIMTKTQSDALQIVEQIIPFFKPQYTVTIKPFADYPDVKEDVPITIQSVDFSDDYEGAVEQRRMIIYTLTFEMKVNFYGPVNDDKVINTTTMKFDIDTKDIADSDYLTITTTPTPGGVSADSDYGFLEVYDYESE
jgi:hypothetical protein